ncbi:hypothetical protein ACFPL7_01365 [Dongia soli]|uniref:Uncharacterized protein n=1 Tax=Dongia soli TaxID=600628 RepID=A0ABU5EEH8_9PROT|nr:hypothetical protein [Dongia soli]MDY0884244.1 hypothetical protein [Dongia soli]
MTRALTKRDRGGNTDAMTLDGIVREVQSLPRQANNNMVGFIAARSGEGVSTVASLYARSVADNHGHTVLKVRLDESDTEPSADDPTLLQCALKEARRDDAIYESDHPFIYETSLASIADSSRKIIQCLSDDHFWNDLRSQFDTIVFDLPAIARTRLPLAIAPYLDGVILVVQAEASREPVVRNLIDGLSRAKILGCVMNRRRHHIPKFIYRALFG